MKILLDSMMPVKIKHSLAEHDVTHAAEIGWQQLSNGKLLAAAEHAGFDVLITKDTNMSYQQNLTGRTISLLVLRPITQDFNELVALSPEILRLLPILTPGSVTRIAT